MTVADLNGLPLKQLERTSLLGRVRVVFGADHHKVPDLPSELSGMRVPDQLRRVFAPTDPHHYVKAPTSPLGLAYVA